MYVYLQIALVKRDCPLEGSKIGLALHPEDTIIVPEHLL